MASIEIKMLMKCLECNRQFTLLDVRAGNYAGETGICLDCYQKMAKDTGTCFGKKTVGRTLGYDPEAIECAKFCYDREVCKRFIEGTFRSFSKKLNT